MQVKLGKNMILEMQLLLVYTLSVIFLLVIQSALTTRQHGLAPLVGNRKNLSITGMAGRSDRAVKNSLI